MTWKITLVVILAIVVILGCIWEWLVHGRNRRPPVHHWDGHG